MSMTDLKVKLEIQTPEELATVFWHMDSLEQARFFNTLAEISDWRFPFQLQHITESDGITLAGRRVMQEIGEYSHWGLSCNLMRETEWS